jgi:hypothetical protein
MREVWLRPKGQSWAVRVARSVAKAGRFLQWFIHCVLHSRLHRSSGFPRLWQVVESVASSGALTIRLEEVTGARSIWTGREANVDRPEAQAAGLGGFAAV